MRLHFHLHLHFKAPPRRFQIHCIRQHPVNFTGLAGIVNTTVYMTEPIFTGIGHGKLFLSLTLASQWRHNELDGVSSHLRLGCLLNRLFRHRSKKISKLRVTGLYAGGIQQWQVNSPHKGSVMRKMFPFDDGIMGKHDKTLCIFHRI